MIDDGLSSTESALLGFPSFLDNVIMVVESGYTRRDQLQEGIEALKKRAGLSLPAQFWPRNAELARPPATGAVQLSRGGREGG